MILELCLISILAPLSILLLMQAMLPTPPNWEGVKYRDIAVFPDGTPIYTRKSENSDE